MPSFYFEVYCSCGAGLCRQATVEQEGDNDKITIDPCPVCLREAKDEGLDEGYDKGYSAGFTEGEEREGK